jgi:hypothetical protein
MDESYRKLGNNLALFIVVYLVFAVRHKYVWAYLLIFSSSRFDANQS